jgi:hypothetical protein
MRTVPLGGAKAAGRVMKVDDGDYDLMMGYRWHVKEDVNRRTGRKSGPYGETTLPGGKQHLYAHRLITGWARVDHWNGDGLDNQRHNLRDGTGARNTWNSRPYLGSSSPYKGVCWFAGRDQWMARITVDGSQHHLGYFPGTPEGEIMAALAFDTAARELHGAYAWLNFPREGEIGGLDAWSP